MPEDVVEFVGHAAGEPLDVLHLLAAHQLMLEASTRAGVIGDQADHAGQVAGLGQQRLQIEAQHQRLRLVLPGLRIAGGLVAEGLDLGGHALQRPPEHRDDAGVDGLGVGEQRQLVAGPVQQGGQPKQLVEPGIGQQHGAVRRPELRRRIELSDELG